MMSLDRAAQLRDLGLWNEAAAAYAEVLASEPHNEDALVGHAQMLIALMAYDTAIEEFSRVLDRNPSRTDARYNRAYTYTLLRRDAEAVADLDQLLADGFVEWYVWGDRGALMLRNGLVSEALEDLREAERIAPNEPMLQHNLGIALMAVDQDREAFRHLSQAANAGLAAALSLREDARCKLAQSFGKKDVHAAVDFLTIATSQRDVVQLTVREPALLAPDVTEAVVAVARGRPLADQPALERWIEVLRRLALAAADVRPLGGARPVHTERSEVDDTGQYNTLVDRLTQLNEEGLRQEAAELAPQVAAVARNVYGPESTQYGLQMLNLALLAASRDDWDSAEPALSLAVDVLSNQDPGLLTDGLASLAGLLSAAERMEKARSTYELAVGIVQRFPDQVNVATAARVYASYGEALLAVGEPQLARTLLEAAVAAPVFAANGAEDPLALVINTLGLVMFALGQPADAIPLCQRVLELARQRHGDMHREVAIALRNLGRACWAAGRQRDAQIWLTRSIATWQELGGAPADLAELAATESDLALAYAQAGARSEARALADRTHASLSVLGDVPSKHARYALDQLRETFHLLGDLERELDAQLKMVAEVRRLELHEPGPRELSTLSDIYFRQRRYEEALQCCIAALDAAVKTTSDDILGIAVLRHNLANVLVASGQVNSGLEQHEEAIAGFRQALDANDPRLLHALIEVAGLYYNSGRTASAGRLLSEATPHLGAYDDLKLRAAMLALDLGEEIEPPLTILEYESLSRKASIAIDEGDHGRAIVLLQRALPNAIALVGPRHVDIATIEHNLAIARIESGIVAGSDDLLRDALDIRVDAFGPEHLATSHTRLRLAQLLMQHDGEAEAAQLAEQLLEVPLDERPDMIGQAHTILGLVAQSRGEPQEAESHLRAAVRLADDMRDLQSRTTARRNLVSVLLDLRRLTEAERLAAETVDLAMRHADPDGIEIAKAILTRAQVLRAQGRFIEGEPLVRQAIAMLERLGVTDSNSTLVNAYNELSIALHGQYQPERAEAWLRKALAGAGTTSLYLTILHNHAQVNRELGNLQHAADLARKAVETVTERVGRKSRQYGVAVSHLGAIEVELGLRHEGIQHLGEGLSVIGATMGEDHSELLAALGPLARIYLEIGARNSALGFARAAARIARRSYPARHPAVAQSLVDLARCEAAHGSTAEALQLSIEAVDIAPNSTLHLRWLGWLQAAIGDRRDALGTLRRLAVLQDAQLEDVLAGAPERQRVTFAAELWQSANEFLTLALGSEPDFADPTIVREAWELVVRRRAINAEYLRRERMAAYSAGQPSVAGVLRDLAGVRAELARVTLLQESDQLRRLTVRREELERMLASRISLTPADPTQLAAAIPSDTTYIEYVQSTVVQFANLALRQSTDKPSDRNLLQPRPPSRYLGFVVTSKGSEDITVRAVDLGDVQPIEDHIHEWRARLPPSGHPRAALVDRDQYGEVLRSTLLDPLMAFIEPDRQRLLIVTDGAIGQLPLQVLPTRTGRRLIDEHPIAYASSAWDLSRLEPSRHNQRMSPPLIMADPDYNLGDGPPVIDGPIVPPLPGTRTEARELTALLGTEPYTGRAAVKKVLSEASSPSLIHLATHGLYLPSPEPPSLADHFDAVYVVSVPGDGNFVVGADRGYQRDPTETRGLPLPHVDPLLRSALILAGFNTWLSGGTPPEEVGNGLLTADDVCGLNLQYTRIVVLSACNTGLGDLQPAEGVVGLRWAFAVAGAGAVVTSLWRVPDRQTQELMVEFYRRLLDGVPVSDALRMAQSRLRERYPDPFWWGAFVCHGDPTVSLR